MTLAARLGTCTAAIWLNRRRIACDSAFARDWGTGKCHAVCWACKSPIDKCWLRCSGGRDSRAVCPSCCKWRNIPIEGWRTAMWILWRAMERERYSPFDTDRERLLCCGTEEMLAPGHLKLIPSGTNNTTIREKEESCNCYFIKIIERFKSKRVG